MSLFTVLLFVTALVLVLNKFRIWVLRYRTRLAQWRQFPGSDSLPFIGHLLEFKNHKDILSTALKYQREYGLTFRVQLGREHLLFTADPRLMEFVTTSHIFINKSFGAKFLKNWLGDGLITSTDSTWKVHRRLITPTFHFKILEDFVPIFNKNANNLVKFFREKRLNKEFDAYEDFLLCALDTICETAMGISIDALKNRNQSDYVKSIQFMGESMMKRPISFWRRFDFLYNMSSEGKEERKMLNIMQQVTNDVIKTRKAEFLNRRTTNTENEFGRKKCAVFLDQLLASLEQNGGFMTTKELREEVDTFIFAGHDTVASAISFAIYFLSKHQNVQYRVYEEIMQVYDLESELSFEKLPELKYLDCVIKETLRLCPSVPLHSRIITEDVFFDGKVIPKGVQIVLFPYGSHRNENLFENPEKFDPDRFLDENYTKTTLFAYLPFNAGPRNCIGRKYAMTAMKCILSKLLKELKFIEAHKFQIDPVAEGVLRSSTGIRVKIENR